MEDPLEVASLELCENGMFIACTDVEKPCRGHRGMVHMVFGIVMDPTEGTSSYGDRQFVHIVPGVAYGAPQSVKFVPKDEANLVTSLVVGTKDKHQPALDIDFEARLYPSHTPGHHHLFLNKEMSHKDYIKMLRCLAEVGILEKGWVETARKEGYTGLWLPGEKAKNL